MSVQMGGSTKQKPQTTTQTRAVAAPSAQEAMLQQINQQVAQQQAQELQRAMTQQQQYEGSQGYQQAQQLGTQAGGLLQQDMAGGSLISPAQQQALQQYFQSIMAPQQQQMQQTASQEAARRGMTIADSPIGNGYLQQLANYNAQMGGQQAGQALQLQQNNRGMQQNLMGLGQQLQQNASQNRLALAQAQPRSYALGNQFVSPHVPHGRSGDREMPCCPNHPSTVGVVSLSPLSTRFKWAVTTPVTCPSLVTGGDRW